MDADLDTLATALYVRTDDLLKDHPHRLPWRPAVGIAPRISDAEMVTLAVMQALLGHASEARWLRFADEHLRHLFPYLPKQPGYNKRLRRLAATLNWLLGALARDTSVWTDDVWVVDSTRVECARSRETVRRSDLAGWAEYGMTDWRSSTNSRLAAVGTNAWRKAVSWSQGASMRHTRAKAVSLAAMAAVPLLAVAAAQAATSTPPGPSTGGGQSNAAKAASSFRSMQSYLFFGLRSQFERNCFQ